MNKPKFEIWEKAKLESGEIGTIVDRFGSESTGTWFYRIQKGLFEIVVANEKDLKPADTDARTQQVAQEQSFVNFVCNVLDKQKELFRRKNSQYAAGGDPLSNFRAGARLRAGVDSWAEMYEEAKNYRRKHVVHVERNGIDGDKVDESLHARAQTGGLKTMNEPIISPWLFYWLEVLDNLRGVMVGILLLSTMIAAFSPIFFADDHLREFFRTITRSKFLRNCVIAIVFMSAIGLLFVPTKETALRMVIASYATPQNIEFITEKTGKAIDSSVDYIVDKIIEAGSKWEQRNNGNNN